MAASPKAQSLLEKSLFCKVYIKKKKPRTGKHNETRWRRKKTQVKVASRDDVTWKFGLFRPNRTHGFVLS